MKPRHVTALLIVGVIMLTAACVNTTRTDEQAPPPPPVSTTPHVLTPDDRERAHETGQIIGEHLRDGWEVSKSFGEGVLSTITEDR